MTIVKSQFIKNMVSKQLHLQSNDVVDCIGIIIDEMTNAMVQGKRIEIRGFGSFSLHYRAPRKAHNPKTGAKVMTQAKYMPHFKPGKELRERINASRHQHPIHEEET